MQQMYIKSYLVYKIYTNLKINDQKTIYGFILNLKKINTFVYIIISLKSFFIAQPIIHNVWNSFFKKLLAPACAIGTLSYVH